MFVPMVTVYIFLLLLDVARVICWCQQVCRNPRPGLWHCIAVSSSDLNGIARRISHYRSFRIEDERRDNYFVSMVTDSLLHGMNFAVGASLEGSR